MFDDNENDNMIDIIDIMYKNIIPDYKSENKVSHIEHANELEAVEIEVENEAVGSEDEEMNENNDPSEDEKLRDQNNPEIYVMKVLKSALQKTKQNKKKDRVYNAKHAFFVGN
ncbi:hypothetical protein DPMN_074112 [Dreissena polymorpha]|uniref:Uncharacterized protein n=1 Tax=Dreissena polymorpha TaxID=45954 RepID=A0A9D3YI06_DREPO|nr:hypothetical protein DPMN_074112 [Dreissena polymorpha]